MRVCPKKMERGILSGIAVSRDVLWVYGGHQAWDLFSQEICVLDHKP